MDESLTMRDPRVEARVASSAYAQARAVLDDEPKITAAGLVERLRQRSVELADAVGEDPVARALKRHRPPHISSRGGLATAAAEAREGVD